MLPHRHAHPIACQYATLPQRVIGYKSSEQQKEDEFRPRISPLFCAMQLLQNAEVKGLRCDRAK
jgi:hypothetical protein